MGKTGRPSKLTPEKQKDLVDLIGEGNTIETACALVNLNPDTFYTWMKRGWKPNTVFSEFAEAIRKARAAAESWHVANIKKHADKSWAASAWHLERSNPDKWALRRSIEATPEPSPVEDAPNFEAVKAVLLQLVEDHPEVREQLAKGLEAISP
jgi:hypothetical protein